VHVCNVVWWNYTFFQVGISLSQDTAPSVLHHWKKTAQDWRRITAQVLVQLALNGKETCSVCNLITQKLAEMRKTVTFADNMHTKYYFSAQKLRPSTNLSAPQSTPPAQMNLSCSWIAKVHGCYSISLLGAAWFAYTLCVLNTELKDSHLQCIHTMSNTIYLFCT